MRCLIIGGSGQDGVIVAAKLLAEGHRVVAVSRRPSPLAAVEQRILDITEHEDVERLVAEIVPDEIYYLAAHHRSSQDGPLPLDADIAGCLAVNTLSFASLLAAVARHASAARTVYASSCRIFGLGDGRLIDETFPWNPVCPYGLSKQAGMQVAAMYRRQHGLFVSSAILFNHESELRPAAFITKKLAIAALAARRDPSVRVPVGDLDAVADWCSARDAAAAMQAIMRSETADDYIVATGRLHTVRDLAAASFNAVGLDWTRHVVAAQTPQRPRWLLVGNSGKLRKSTGWQLTLDFESMVRDIVERTERYEQQRPADFHSYL